MVPSERCGTGKITELRKITLPAHTKIDGVGGTGIGTG